MNKIKSMLFEVAAMWLFTLIVVFIVAAYGSYQRNQNQPGTANHAPSFEANNSVVVPGSHQWRNK